MRAMIAMLLMGAPMIEKVDLFEAGKGGYHNYRIPGIVATPKGTLLAYCEARSREHDWAAIDLVMRRSEDGGKTWSAMEKFGQLDGKVVKNPLALKVKGVKEEDVTYNNPVAIVDRKTGHVHMVYCVEYMRCFHIVSEDEGKTWSKPVEITKAFDAFAAEYPWKVLATGPGHGIQLKSGRFVVPVWLSLGTGGNAHHPSVAATIVSDDAGKTWKRGDIAVPNQGKLDPNESSVVELADGRVMMITRNHDASNRKLVAFSADGATGWTKPAIHEDLYEPICQASVHRLSLAEVGGKNRLIFSNPNNLDPRPGQKATPGSSRERKNLSIKLSEDEGKTWPIAKILEPGNSGYSDLTVSPDGSIVCFYERWNVPGAANKGYRLTAARVNGDWLEAK